MCLTSTFSVCGPIFDVVVCSGRMRGQAFVNFLDTASALLCIQEFNGVQLMGNELQLEMARPKKHPS